jgi:predicted O-methyltransferase YrrM
VHAVSQVAHAAVHRGCRWRGRAQLRRLTTSGAAPTATLAALRRALSSRPAPQEHAWVTEIERRRDVLASSPEPLEIVEFGAGSGHRFDTGDAETTNVTVRTLGDMTRSSKPMRWAYLLFRLVHELRPVSVLELGACVGISAAYQAAALELNGEGRLTTLEGAPALAAQATASLAALGLEHRAAVVEGRFADTLDGVLAELRPIGLAFVDGHHVESATLGYMERILAAAEDEAVLVFAVLVFDDIHWSPGMTRAWRAIAPDPRFALTLDLRSLGIAVVSASATPRTSAAMSYG